MKQLLLSIPFSRLMIYLVALGTLPLLYIPYDYSQKMKALAQLEENFQSIQHKAIAKEKKQELNTIVRALYGKSDPGFLERRLGKLQLLEREREAYQKLMKECSFPGALCGESRFRFLTGEENRLHFTNGAVQTKDRIEESLETLAHPVEIDANDLKKILNLIEERQAGAPQLIIADLKLNKKITPNKREVYEINMQLIKREFLS